MGSKHNVSPGDGVSLALFRAYNRMLANYRPLLEPYGLTYMQYLVLGALLDRSPLTAGDLAMELGPEASSINNAVLSLQTARLVLRVRDPEMRRGSKIVLTEGGESLRETLSALSANFDKLANAGPEADSIPVILDRMFSE